MSRGAEANVEYTTVTRPVCLHRRMCHCHLRSHSWQTVMSLSHTLAPTDNSRVEFFDVRNGVKLVHLYYSIRKIQCVGFAT